MCLCGNLYALEKEPPTDDIHAKRDKAVATVTPRGWFQGLLALQRGDGLRARLIRGGLGSAGIQAANRVLGLAMGVVLARTLGAEGYGVYAYAFSIMSLLMVAAEAGVPTLLMREAAASEGRGEWGHLRGILRRAGQFVALASTTISLLGLLVVWWQSESLTPAVLYTTTLMLLVLPLSAGAKTLAHAMMGLHRVVIGQAVDMLLRPVLVLGLVGTVFLLWPEWQQPQVAMAAQLLAALVVLIVGWLVLRRLTPAPARTARPVYQTRAWLRSALPFTLIGGALVVSHQTDIIMLGWFAPSSEVGAYRVATQGALLVAFSLQVANASFSPNFAHFYARQDFSRLQNMVMASARVIMVVSLPLVLVFLLWGDVLAAYIFGHEFEQSYHALAILSVGQFLAGGFGCIGVLMSMSGRERILAKGLWTSSVLNVFLNLILVPLYSGMGAAIATSVSWLILHVFLFISVKRSMGIKCQPFISSKLPSSAGD
jgi:O-antigen/teichoic acid export membrane protein